MPPLSSVSRTFPVNGSDLPSVLWFRSVSPCLAPTLVRRSLCQAHAVPSVLPTSKGPAAEPRLLALSPLASRVCPRPPGLGSDDSATSDVRQEMRGWGCSGHTGHRDGATAGRPGTLTSRCRKCPKCSHVALMLGSFWKTQGRCPFFCLLCAERVPGFPAVPCPRPRSPQGPPRPRPRRAAVSEPSRPAGF